MNYQTYNIKYVLYYHYSKNIRVSTLCVLAKGFEMNSLVLTFVLIFGIPAVMILFSVGILKIAEK